MFSTAAKTKTSIKIIIVSASVAKSQNLPFISGIRHDGLRLSAAFRPPPDPAL
jgi:hypothetical protein